jgi:acetate kinase
VRVLALNCGSSSFKSAVVDTDSDRRVFEWSREGIDPAEAVAQLARELAVAGPDVQPEALAHRIVHGGMRFSAAVRLDDDSLAQIGALARLAPLHQPSALAAVRAARVLWPQLPHVAVFDTAFHATLPRRAREYALPEELRTAHGLRRFGFHGISHANVARRIAARLKCPPDQLRVVSCHLGSGASCCAIEYGRSVETSMGMTPLEGLVMAGRAGDLDAGILLELQRSAGFSVDALDELLNRGSGLVGLAGTGDMRQVEARAAAGEEGSRLALAVYSHRVRKYIGAYAAAMGGVDVIAFTGGVGEHSAQLRHRCLQRLEFLGAVLDEDRNRDAVVDAARPCAVVSGEDSRVHLVVVRADEEAEMARETAVLLALPAPATQPRRVPVAISARHAHLSQKTLDVLFGAGYVLTPHKPLSQPGQFAAVETITVLGPRGRIGHVRVLGPPRAADQVEISRSDEFVLGLDAPVRLSGDLANTPGATLEGPAGRALIASGVICARRHIHSDPESALRLGLRHGEQVAVAIGTGERRLVFEDVSVRVSREYRLELHLDTDEANAAGVVAGDYAELIELPLTAAAPPRH